MTASPWARRRGRAAGRGRRTSRRWWPTRAAAPRVRPRPAPRPDENAAPDTRSWGKLWATRVTPVGHRRWWRGRRSGQHGRLGRHEPRGATARRVAGTMRSELHALPEKYRFTCLFPGTNILSMEMAPRAGPRQPPNGDPRPPRPHALADALHGERAAAAVADAGRVARAAGGDDCRALRRLRQGSAPIHPPRTRRVNSLPSSSSRTAPVHFF